MKSIHLIELMKELHRPLFTINDLVKISNEKRPSLKVHLFRMKEKKMIIEVERGKYAMPQHPYITASHLLFPAYISFLSAYAYYQLTTQIPRKIQVVALRSKKKLSLDSSPVEFIRFTPKRFFGYKKERFMEKYVFIAEKEKAIVDSLYLPECCPIDETANALKALEELDQTKLVEYAIQMDSIALLKRVGYLFEKNGIDIYNKVKMYLNKRYDLLNPLRKGARERNEKWRLLINEVI